MKLMRNKSIDNYREDEENNSLDIQNHFHESSVVVVRSFYRILLDVDQSRDRYLHRRRRKKEQPFDENLMAHLTLLRVVDEEFQSAFHSNGSPLLSMKVYKM